MIINAAHFKLLVTVIAVANKNVEYAKKVA